jgi:hypothetical protein
MGERAPADGTRVRWREQRVEQRPAKRQKGIVGYLAIFSGCRLDRSLPS